MLAMSHVAVGGRPTETVDGQQNGGRPTEMVDGQQNDGRPTVLVDGLQFWWTATRIGGQSGDLNKYI
jgi:hypothetical protein